MDTDTQTSKGPIQVEKKDGRLEDFDKSKIIKSCTSAGCALEDSDMIASKVEDWCQEMAGNGPIKTSSIREKVIEGLKEKDKDAAQKYESYVKA